jgi:hypothetical protein
MRDEETKGLVKAMIGFLDEKLNKNHFEREIRLRRPAYAYLLCQNNTS